MNADPNSVNSMLSGLELQARKMGGGSAGVLRSWQKGKPLLGFGQPFDPFSGPPPGMMPPQPPVTNNYDGAPESPAAAGAPAAPGPRAPMKRRMMGSAGGGGLDQFQRMQQRGPGSIPFGGAFANGGMAPAGKASLVGEDGPELIVPSGPTQVIPMRSPMAARPSPQNHSYGGGLAERPRRPVGRSGYDLNRIAEQQFRRSGNPAMLLQMDWRNRMGPSPSPTPAFTPPLPMAPAAAAPTGRLVPGISAGSMVWQPDAPDLPVPMMSEEAPPSFGPAPTAPTAPRPMESGAPSQPLRGMPGTFDPALLPWELPMQPPKAGGFGVTGLMPDPNKGAFNPMAPLAASPLAHYTPPPPALDFRPLPGNPGYGVAVVNGQVQKQFLPVPQPDAPLPANFQPESATRGGVRYAPPVTAKDSKPPDFTFEKDDMGRITGGVYPVQDENGKWRLQRVDINGDGKIAPAEAAKAAAAATAPAAAPNGKPASQFLRAFGA